jgi:predicted AAA+ superfamily ATPase
MNVKELVSYLEEIHERIKLSLTEKLRPLYKTIELKNTRAVLVYGQRGVGKTTFLLYRSKDKPFLYLSADHPLILAYPLYEVVREVFARGYEGVIIDEVHHARDWSLHLKALYDDYPERYIWASGSSSLLLKTGIADLSRRFIQIKLPLISFREYLYLTSKILTDPVDLFNIKKEVFEVVKKVNILRAFREYVSAGTRPIFFEGEYCKRIQGIIEKTIFYDVPFFLPSIQSNHLRLMQVVFGYLISSPVPTINVTKLCNEWHVGKEKLYQLLSIMEALELLRIVRKKGDKSVYSKGAKMLINDPSVYYCYKGNLGSAREAFVVFSLSERYEIYASLKEEECDYFVNEIKIGVGGRKKELKGADFVIADDLEVPVKNRLPMWLLGFLW